MAGRFTCDDVELDLDNLRLTVGGDIRPLEPKTFRVLQFLVEHRGRVAAKPAIMSAVWADTFVTDNVLTRAIAQIRKALDDDPKAPRYIETVPTVGYRFVGAFAEDTPTAAPASASRNTTTAMAVLPILNMTGDSELDYLADGLTDGTIRLLSKLPALKVMARSTVAGFNPGQEAARTFAQALAVDVLVVGALRRSGDRVVLTVELSRVDEGTVVSSGRYFCSESDVMDVQADLLRDILRALQIDAWGGGDGVFPRPTTSAEAYQHLLQAGFLARRETPGDLHRAIEELDRAVALDPNFGLAWAGKAQLHLMLGLYFEPPRQQMPLARDAAERALALDSAVHEASASLGLVSLVYDWDSSAAQAALASSHAANYAVLSLACAAHLMDQTGRSRNAEERLHDALAYDPRNPTLVAELGCNDYYRGHYDKALVHYRAAEALDRLSPLTYWGTGKSLAQLGRYEEAAAALRRFKAIAGFEPPIITSELGYVLGRAGEVDEARRIAADLIAARDAQFVDPYLVALVYLGTGDTDRAFEWLERAREERSSFLISIPSDPRWASSRSDPRFQAMLRHIGF